MSSILPKKILEEFEEVAKKLKLTKKEKEKALKVLEEKYLNALIEPQEPIGTVTAQSFGEPATQMLLNAFHFAGVAEVQLMTGLPRLIEILDAKREPSTPSMTIYLERNDPKLAEKVAKEIVEVKLKDIVKNFEIDFLENAIIAELDEAALREHEIRKEEIAKKIKVHKGSVKLDGNRIIIKLNKKRPKELYQAKLKIKEIRVKGVKGISYALIRRDELTGELIIQTLGSNLREVLKIDGVDSTRTVTNNFYELAEVLGIDAAREAIIREIKEVLAKSNLEIDDRYILLVADLMTWYGDVFGFTRYGLMSRKPSYRKSNFRNASKKLNGGWLNRREQPNEKCN